VSAFPYKELRSTAPRLAAAALFAAAVFVSAGTGAAQTAPVLPRSEALVEAERAMAAGRPFAASRLLAPVLATPAGKQSAVILLAARAAAAWEGWGTVVRLLASQTWLDEVARGEGRALLARARVERGQTPLDDARHALLNARGDALGPPLVTLARAFDRGNLLDSAAATYLRAAAEFPDIADWLRLRAAGVLADSLARTPLYTLISLPTVAARIRWTEALARDRSGDWRGAARIYDALGATLAAARLRLKAARGPAELAAVRRELVGLLTPRLPLDDVRDAIALLDETFPHLTREEELLIARRAAVPDPGRAARGYGRAAAGKPLSDADKLGYGGVLQRLGRHHDSGVLLATIKSRELRAQARYLQARSLLASGARAQAIAELQDVSLTPAGDSVTGAMAGYLVAELQVDDGDDTGARQTYLDIARRFARTSHGARAALQAAMLAWVHGDRVQATQEFLALSARAAETTEGVAALYWSGRGLFQQGDSGGAAARWRSLLERFPASYYTVPAAERLGAQAVREPPPVLTAPADSGVVAALDRASLLDHLGLRVEARFEYERLLRQVESTPGMLLGTARAFAERGLLGRAFRLALRTPETLSQRLAFPLPDAETLGEARRAGVDPLLTAALIRQESAFDPYARSRADARGLMQVLPSVGAGMAPAAGISEWDPALLFQPEINVHFGIAHLAQALQRYPLLVATLAAYNAGERPTNRWLSLPGAREDPEVFIERIQFVETRDYVRRVLRNLAVYRAFYPLVP
jgi:peptidoglycan lytic transglycosylase